MVTTCICAQGNRTHIWLSHKWRVTARENFQWSLICFNITCTDDWEWQGNTSKTHKLPVCIMLFYHPNVFSKYCYRNSKKKYVYWHTSFKREVKKLITNSEEISIIWKLVIIEFYIHLRSISKIQPLSYLISFILCLLSFISVSLTHFHSQ